MSTHAYKITVETDGKTKSCTVIAMEDMPLEDFKKSMLARFGSDRLKSCFKVNTKPAQANNQPKVL